MSVTSKNCEIARKIFFARLYDRNNVWNTVTPRVQIILWIQPRGTLFPLLPCFLSTSIGKFSGCCKKVYPFSRVSARRLRLPPSVSFYKSRNPIPESTSDYAATCASLRIDIIYATTEMRDERPMKSSSSEHLPRWFHTSSPLPTPRKVRDFEVLRNSPFCYASFKRQHLPPWHVQSCLDCFPIHHSNTLVSCSLHLSASLKRILITTINNHSVKKDWTN